MTKKELALTKGDYPVIQNSLTPLGLYKDFNRDEGGVFVISAGAAGEVGYLKEKFWAADDCFTFTPIHSNSIGQKYLYHVLINESLNIKRMVRKASIPRISKGSLLKLKIPLPPLEKQKEIVEILDKFEKLTNDISQGLPAEIAARRKQYEYYRNKLLTFNELP